MAFFVIAQKEAPEEIQITEDGVIKNPPPGMELIKIGKTNVLAPKGARINKVAGFQTIEATDQYAARKFMEVENRLKAIEANQRKLLKTVMQINQILKRIAPSEA